MSTNHVGLNVGSNWGALSKAAFTPSTQGPGTLSQDRAYTAFAGGILAALSANPVSGPDASGSSAGTDPNRVGSVASALQSALQNGDGSAASADALVATVEKALDQASQALSQAGYSADAIASFRTSFTQQLSDQLGALANAASPSPPSSTVPSPVPSPVPSSDASGASGTSDSAGTSSTATAAQYRETEKANLQLLTAEGDVVTISLRSKSRFDAVGASASGAGGLAAYAQVSSFSSSQFKVSVQGNLNGDELKAINDVLGQVSQVASQFFSGNVSQAFSSASALGFDPKEIAGVALSLSQRTSLAISTVSDGGSAPAVPATAPADSSTTPVVSTAPASTTDTPTTDAATTPVATSPPATDTGGSTTPAAASTPPATTSSDSAAQSLVDFLQKALDALGSTSGSGSVQISAKAKLTLLEKTVSSTTSSSPEQTAADFLKRVLAALTDASSSGSSTPAATTPASSTTPVSANGAASAAA